MSIIGLTGSTGSLGKTILKFNKINKINCYKNDILNRSAVFDWIKKNKIDIVIHLAAIVPIKVVNKNKKEAEKVNYIGTKNIVDACIANKVKWFFFSSTSHVYKQSKNSLNELSATKPYSFYGKTKLKAEKYIIKNFEKLPNKVKLVLIDMHYNLGLSKLLGFEKMLDAIDQRDFKKAAEELKRQYDKIKRQSSSGKRNQTHIKG